ncbi:hypothetical protein GGR19_002759 [Croceicoccus naphthovorans]|nr:hypothetical protein [Croceicoccus naphthovorans]
MIGAAGNHKMLCTDGYGQLGSTIRISGACGSMDSGGVAVGRHGGADTDSCYGRFTDGSWWRDRAVRH